MEFYSKTFQLKLYEKKIILNFIKTFNFECHSNLWIEMIWTILIEIALMLTSSSGLNNKSWTISVSHFSTARCNGVLFKFFVFEISFQNLKLNPIKIFLFMNYIKMAVYELY